MHSIMRRYLQILEIELDDLKEDIDLLIDKYKEKHNSGEITNYVFLENLAVLQSEICGIGSFKKILAAILPEDYTSLDDFIRDIEQRFKARITECGIGEGIYLLIERKLQKVFKYVTHE